MPQVFTGLYTFHTLAGQAAAGFLRRFLLVIAAGRCSGRHSGLGLYALNVGIQLRGVGSFMYPVGRQRSALHKTVHGNSRHPAVTNIGNRRRLCCPAATQTATGKNLRVARGQCCRINGDVPCRITRQFQIDGMRFLTAHAQIYGIKLLT